MCIRITHLDGYVNFWEVWGLGSRLSMQKMVESYRLPRLPSIYVVARERGCIQLSDLSLLQSYDIEVPDHFRVSGNCCSNLPRQSLQVNGTTRSNYLFTMACLSPADSIHATSLFGIGVRVGYYLQWYTLIFEERYLDQEFPATEVSLLLFMVANTLTILIKIKELDPAVIYVTLLLTFGYWYNILPLIAWFFIALMSKKLRLNWNASIFPRSREPNPKLEGLWTFFLLGILSYTIYFWIETIPELRDTSKWCGENGRYGFFFDKISL